MAGEKGATTSRNLNKLQYDIANKASSLTAPSTDDRIPIADVSADYQVKAGTFHNLDGPFAVTTNAAASPAAAGVVPAAAFKTGRGALVTSSGANAVAYLPKSSTVPAFAMCAIGVGANGFELRGNYGSTTDAINGVNASTGKELAVAANETLVVFKRAAANYVAFGVTSAGAMGSTEATTGVPD